MEIRRNPDREQFLFSEIRKSFATSDIERNKTIHLSDLLSPRQAYWKKVMPMLGKWKMEKKLIYPAPPKILNRN